MKNNNLRKGILIASTLILAAVISVGATLAYLTANTNTKTNTFTAGEGINIELQEPSYVQKEFRMPGDEFDKDPQVKNTSEDSPIYTVISLEYKIDGTSVPYDTFVNTANNKHAIIKYNDTEGFNTSKWEKLNDNDANLDYFVYGTKTTPTSVAKNTQTEAIFDKVVISEKDTGNTKYEIIAIAYAVNADGELTESVFTELAELTGGKITASGKSFN